MKTDEELSNDKKALFERFGVGKKLKDVPTLVENEMGVWINPYLVAKFYLEKGLPKDVVLEEIKSRGYGKDMWDGEFAETGWDDWSDKNVPGWCDFWFETFKRIPKNNL